MEHRKIVYLNTFAWGSAHEMYNASVLCMCARRADRVVCRTSKSNYRAMCHTLGAQMPANICFRPTPTLGGKGKYALLFRYILGAVLDFGYLLFSARGALIVMPFNNLFGLRTINALNRFLHRRILICCHGEMEAIASTINRKGLLSKILHRRCTRFFLDPKVRLSDGIYFSVLGDRVKENLGAYIDPYKMARFVALDHPYIFSRRSKERRPAGAPLRVGTAGAINRSKGLDRLLAYAKLCNEKGLDVVVSHTGRIFGAEPDLARYVALPDTEGELDRREYDQRLAGLDYMLFFYDTGSYRITASGAIMDALAAGTPIIALRNDYFEYLFGKFGAFGYLADTVGQMVSITEQLLDGKPTQEFDIPAIRARLSPESIQMQFDTALDQIEQ